MNAAMNHKDTKTRSGLKHFAARGCGQHRTVNRSDEWYTPMSLIQSLGEFDLDPACGEQCPNHTANHKYSTMGLERKWYGRVWLNPPFSNVRPWVQKMIEHGNGVLLVFARTDAIWFQNVVQKAGGMFCIQSRLQFSRPDGTPNQCPMGTVLIPFGEQNVKAVANCGLKGIFLSVSSPRLCASVVKSK